MTNLLYTPTEDEIYRALKKSGVYKTSGTRMIVENLILAAFCIYFIVSFCMNITDYFALAMAVVCAVFIFIVWFVPHHDMKKQAKSGAEEEIKMSISEKMISIGSDQKEWTVSLDGSSQLIDIDEDIFAIKTPDSNLVLLPKRAIPKDKLTDISEILKKGCSSAKGK